MPPCGPKADRQSRAREQPMTSVVIEANRVRLPFSNLGEVMVTVADAAFRHA